ncbi:MAG: hypothetical protein C5B49_01510 [Bdellovibrio sp.]|nr:MAG: hypothetical protein C5B49_01510 [Bdellovibrio sp.]
MKARKEQTVTFRISGEDLEKFKDIASTKALGYQTLLASLVHQYIIGKLIEYSATTPNPLEARVERLEKKLSDKTG